MSYELGQGPLTIEQVFGLVKEQHKIVNMLHDQLNALGSIVLKDREILGGLLKVVEGQNAAINDLIDTIASQQTPGKPPLKKVELPLGWNVLSDE